MIGRDMGKSELHHPRCRVVSFSEPLHLKISIESSLKSFRSFLCLSFSSCGALVGCVVGYMGVGGRTWQCYFIPGQHPHPVYLKEGPAVASTGRKQTVFRGPLTAIILLFGFYYMLNSLQFPGSSFENF